MSLARAPALILTTHRPRKSRFLARRSRYAYLRALSTASVAGRSRRCLPPQNPLAALRILLRRCGVLGPPFVLGIAVSPSFPLLELVGNQLGDVLRVRGVDGVRLAQAALALA